VTFRVRSEAYALVQLNGPATLFDALLERVVELAYEPRAQSSCYLAVAPHAAGPYSAPGGVC
jgi:hypothetical protein